MSIPERALVAANSASCPPRSKIGEAAVDT